MKWTVNYNKQILNVHMFKPKEQKEISQAF